MQNSKDFNRQVVRIEPVNPAKKAIILLHGLGADAGDLSELATHLQTASADCRFIFPNAPLIPVTINGGMLMPAWFDILGFSENSKQDKEGIAEAKMHIDRLIDEQNAQGIPHDQIFIGGFSQGGALALYAGLHTPARLGGIIALSTYLPIADSLSPLHQSLPVFLAHGTHDPVLPLAWAKIAKAQLEGYGCEVCWKEYPFEHTINYDEVNDLKNWLCLR